MFILLPHTNFQAWLTYSSFPPQRHFHDMTVTKIASAKALDVDTRERLLCVLAPDVVLCRLTLDAAPGHRIRNRSETLKSPISPRELG